MGQMTVLLVVATMLAAMLTVIVIHHGRIRPEITMLIEVLRLDKDWIKGDHVWYHPSGIALWKANSDIGLSVK